MRQFSRMLEEGKIKADGETLSNDLKSPEELDRLLTVFRDTVIPVRGFSLCRQWSPATLPCCDSLSDPCLFCLFLLLGTEVVGILCDQCQAGIRVLQGAGAQAERRGPARPRQPPARSRKRCARPGGQFCAVQRIWRTAFHLPQRGGSCKTNRARPWRQGRHRRRVSWQSAQLESAFPSITLFLAPPLWLFAPTQARTSAQDGGRVEFAAL